MNQKENDLSVVSEEKSFDENSDMKAVDEELAKMSEIDDSLKIRSMNSSVKSLNIS